MGQYRGNLSDYVGCEFLYFVMMCNACACRSLVEQFDDARINFVISNKKVCKVTVKAEQNLDRQ
jgi:hypothetical protein